MLLCIQRPEQSVVPITGVTGCVSLSVVLELNPGSSVRVASALNLQATSPALRNFFCNFYHRNFSFYILRSKWFV